MRVPFEHFDALFSILKKEKESFEKVTETNAASNYDQNKEISASQKKDLAEKIISDVKNYEQSQL